MNEELSLIVKNYGFLATPKQTCTELAKEIEFLYDQKNRHFKNVAQTLRKAGGRRIAEFL